MNQIKQDCPTCYGSGGGPDAALRCHMCSGRGTATVPADQTEFGKALVMAESAIHECVNFDECNVLYEDQLKEALAIISEVRSSFFE